MQTPEQLDKRFFVNPTRLIFVLLPELTNCVKNAEKEVKCDSLKP